MAVIVVVDSICAPAEKLINELKIQVVSMNIHFKGTCYRDLVDIQPEEFYRLMRNAKERPSISPPGIEDFLEVFRSILEQGHDPVCLTASSALFDTHQIANGAVNALPTESASRISLIDTKTAGAAAGILAMEAARMAREGMSREVIVSQLSLWQPGCKLLFMAGAFKYFAGTSRKKQLAAFTADLLTIKPVFCMTGGEVFPTGTLRGKKKARMHIIDSIFETTAEAGQVWVAVTHADAEKEALLLKNEIAKKYPGVLDELVPFPPAMGAQSGPGVFGIGYSFI